MNVLVPLCATCRASKEHVVSLPIIVFIQKLFDVIIESKSFSSNKFLGLS